MSETVMSETVADWRKQVIAAYEAYDDFDREMWEIRRVQRVQDMGDEILIQHTENTAFGEGFQIHYLRKNEVPKEVLDWIMNDANFKGDRVTIYTHLLSVLWVEDEKRDRRMILTHRVDKDGKPILVDEDGHVVVDDQGNPLVLDEEGKLVPRV